MLIKETNSDLMKKQQPLPIFSSKNSNLLGIYNKYFHFILIDKPKITKIFGHHRAFKRAYHLNKFRFAIKFYSRHPDEKEYHLNADALYISQISTEDADRK